MITAEVTIPRQLGIGCRGTPLVGQVRQPVVTGIIGYRTQLINHPRVYVIAVLSKLLSLLKLGRLQWLGNPLTLGRLLKLNSLVSGMQHTVFKTSNVLHVFRSLRPCTYGQAYQWWWCILGSDVVEILHIHTATDPASLLSTLSAGKVVERVGRLGEVDLVYSS